MTRVRVDVAQSAERQLGTIQKWWVVHRPEAPGLFVEEVGAALERIARAPHSGAVYRRAHAPSNVRRILLRRTRYHLYYTFDPEAGSAVVRAVWHAVRGRSPRLQ